MNQVKVWKIAGVHLKFIQVQESYLFPTQPPITIEWQQTTMAVEAAACNNTPRFQCAADKL